MTLNELVEKAHRRAVESGWWNPGKTDVECHMLMVTEIAEATECVRNHESYLHYSKVSGKPEGESVELADVIIRIADYFGYKGWNLEHVVKEKMAYNQTRPHRHGGKKL